MHRQFNAIIDYLLWSLHKYFFYPDLVYLVIIKVNFLKNFLEVGFTKYGDFEASSTSKLQSYQRKGQSLYCAS